MKRTTKKIEKYLLTGDDRLGTTLLNSELIVVYSVTRKVTEALVVCGKAERPSGRRTNLARNRSWTILLARRCGNEPN